MTSDQRGVSDESRLRASAHVVDALARRDDLQQTIRAALDKRLDGVDLAVLVLIGAVGALPSQVQVQVPPQLRQAFKGLEPMLPNSSLRDALLEGIKSKRITIDMQAISSQLNGDASGASQFLGQMLRDGMSSDVSSLVPSGMWNWIPDLQDIEGSAITRVLSDMWCRRRGWSEGDQAYHEAKALTYAVKAITSAWFNPDPVAFGLSAWHLYKALQASGEVTKVLEELVAAAVADGDQTITSYKTEVRRSTRVDTMVERMVNAPGGATFAEREQANLQFLDALTGHVNAGRRLS